MLGWIRLLLCLFALYVVPSAMAAQISKEQVKGLDEQVQDIKQDVLEISTALNLLEEKLLYPSNTQVSLFISLVDGEEFELDAIEIGIDGNSVAHHIYSFKELQALREGGLQRVFTGNVMTGDHNLKIGFKARNSQGKLIEAFSDYNFTKDVGPGLVEIRIVGSEQGSGAITFVDR